MDKASGNHLIGGMVSEDRPFHGEEKMKIELGWGPWEIPSIILRERKKNWSL